MCTKKAGIRNRIPAFTLLNSEGLADSGEYDRGWKATLAPVLYSCLSAAMGFIMAAR